MAFAWKRMSQICQNFVRFFLSNQNDLCETEVPSDRNIAIDDGLFAEFLKGHRRIVAMWNGPGGR